MYVLKQLYLRPENKKDYTIFQLGIGCNWYNRIHSSPFAILCTYKFYYLCRQTVEFKTTTYSGFSTEGN